MAGNLQASRAQLETYATSYYYFFQALELLAQDAETQCKRLDYFNVGWEIADDIVRGAEMLTGLPGGGLTEEQKAAIVALAEAADTMPKSVILCDNTHDSQLRGMQHPAWDPLRLKAAALIRMLEPETLRNAEFFRQEQQTQA